MSNKLEHGIEVPLDKLAGLNRTDADHIKHVPEKVGTGYVGILEVFHQLHCLVRFPLLLPNAIRPQAHINVSLCRTWSACILGGK